MPSSFNVTVNRIKAETLRHHGRQCLFRLSAYVGSTYVNQINKFGQVFQVYTQALPRLSREHRGLQKSQNRAGERNHDTDRNGDRRRQKGRGSAADQPLQSLSHRLRLSAAPAPGFSSGQALDIMDQIGAQALPPGTGYEWTAMSYQEKAVGSQIYFVFGVAPDARLFRIWRGSMRAGSCRSP